ncbi:MAG: glycoside hydrolase family 3 C-terminal domain-containing protein [Frankiaceae bacterium]
MTAAANQYTGGADVDEDLLRQRLDALSLEQKVRLLTGADFWALHPEPAIGLRRLVTSDGPAGVRGELWEERDPSANVPSPTALAASWDEAGVEALGALLAAEARGKGVDVLLAPTVNLHRSPFGGRHFECLSEDPLLTGRIGAAYVRGVQGAGVAATVKHYVANDSETERFTLNALVDERVLRELYLAPFEAILREAPMWAVMAAYNSVNGPTMTESPMLQDILKEEWGFDGLVMSDWFAGRSLAAANAGLDLVMPGPGGPWGDALVAAVGSGDVPAARLDDKVLRLLRLAGRVGALDGVPPAAPLAEPLPGGRVSAHLRQTAAAGFVLTRNAEVNGAPVLPLVAPRRVAVLGPNAAHARTLGGGSAVVFPPYTISPLDGIRDALGSDAEVWHAEGVRSTDRVPASIEHLRLPAGSQPGVEVRFLHADGTELGRENRAAASFNWLGSVLPGVPVGAVAAIEVHASLAADFESTYLVGGSGIGPFRLTVDGETLFDTFLILPEGADMVEGMMRPPQHIVPVTVAGGTPASVVLRYEPGHTPPMGDTESSQANFQFNVSPQPGDADAELDRAVALARDADVAVVVVGTTEEVESEGFDRDSLALPGRQDELVTRVAAVNPHTVVVVNSGAPVLLPWAEQVPAILLCWFPGQEFGNALTDVLLGTVEPGGRLPTTWPAAETGLPSVTPVDGTLRYDEGLFIGYRGYHRDDRQPLYWFGHGVGYTNWEYLSADVAAEGGEVSVTVKVRNTGGRRGREVVQVYAGRPGSAVERPVRWLAGFAAVEADPGEAVTATVAIARRAFEHWGDDGWGVEPGEFRLEIGRSAGDLPLTAGVEPPQ